MIKVKQVELSNSESQYVKDGTYTLVEANNILRRAAGYAPDSGAYDKTNFVVIFEDGFRYGGRLDLQRRHMGMPNPLKDHIVGHVRFCTGEHKPYWMTEEQYKETLSFYYDPEELMRDAKEFLKKYEVEAV